MEVDPSDRPVVLVKGVDAGTHPVIPELDNTVVKRGKNPGTGWMEGNTFYSIGFGLKLGQHGPG